MSLPPHKPLALEHAHEAHTDIPGLSRNLASRVEQMFFRLEDNEIERLRRFGSTRSWRPSELLFEAGKRGQGMFVLLRGHVSITRKNALGTSSPIIEHGPGQFMAEVAQLSGRPSLVDGRALDEVEALVIPPPALRAMMIAEAELGSRIMRAFILRRVALIETGGGGPMLIGTANSPRMLQLQGFLSRNGHPYSTLDPAHSCAQAALKQYDVKESELPLVVCPDGGALRAPSDQQVAECLGMLPQIDHGHVYDVAIVGAGPAGLAAAVYAASEGLSTIVMDTFVIGGQAGASSRIENYMGFPTGISGQALTARAFLQASKFGADVVVPVKVRRMDCSATPLALELDCGMRLSTRTVVIASGASYRRPAIPSLANYEGRGVYYWASPIEGRLCHGEEVVLVGGGNSAGQAVVFLATQAAHVHLLIRGDDLGKSMSRYLVDRISSLPNVTLHKETEILALEGDAEGVKLVRWRNRRSGIEETKLIRRVFLFVGADPNTGWLANCGVKTNDKGFVCTGVDLSPHEYVRRAAGSQGRQPVPLETTISGVFAIGDARAGSVKRVAAGVGEGAAVVAQLHAWLADN